MLLLNLRGSQGPLYRRIYQQLKSAIHAGRLGAAARLPSTRKLAEDLGVSRNSVILAYEQLAAEGYVVSRPRSTTSVVAASPGRSPAPAAGRVEERPRLSAYASRLVESLAAFGSDSADDRRPGLKWDFRYGKPSLDEFPRTIWRRLLAARARRGAPESLGYLSPAGYAPLRQALCDYLRRARGLSCEAEQIVIVSGTQQAIDLIGRVLLDPGDAVLVEEPHYLGAILPFTAAGARLVRVNVDRHGLETTKLPPRRAGVRLAYVTPCHQFPSGVIMPLERRVALLDWAARAGAWIVEDDYVSEFRYEGSPLEALQALDRRGRVIYIGTLSKILFPALRLAYLVLPRPLVRPFVSAKWAADRFTATLPQEAMADFIGSGQFERYLRRAAARNAIRRRTLIEALRRHFGERVEIAGENTGVHLVVWLNGMAPDDIPALIARAAAAGVGLYPMTPYYATPLRRAGLLFGYASLSEAEIRAGIRRLAEIAGVRAAA